MSETDFLKQLAAANCLRQQALPAPQAAAEFIDELFNFLFVCSDPRRAHTVAHRYEQLKSSFAALLVPAAEAAKVAAASHQFFATIPGLYTNLRLDAQAILLHDPAAESIDEVMVSYPGFFATAVYRMANQLWRQGWHFVARLFAAHAQSRTGIDIHPGATIGSAFSIDHGTGIVVGATTVIGDGVSLYQGVTLGALQVSKEQATVKRHPTIEDGVVIYAGATILGGNTIVGRNSVIGGNVWLTHSVGPGSLVYHQPDVKIRSKVGDAIHFVI